MIVVPTIRSDHGSIVLNQRFVVYRTGRWRQKFSQHDSNPQMYVCFYLKGRLHVHIPLCYTKARSLHLACLNTPPTARGLATIGCRLSSHMILTFTSLAESSRTIVTTYINTLDGWLQLAPPPPPLHVCDLLIIRLLCQLCVTFQSFWSIYHKK